MRLEDLEIYQISLRLSDEIWDIVIKWGYFEKRGLGVQLTDAADSISSNISEGYGRMFPKDNRRFCIIARGSLYETTTWLYKAHNRKLIDDTIYNHFSEECNNLKVKLWNYIIALNNKIKHDKNDGQS